MSFTNGIEMTKHAKNYRKDRIDFIKTQIGLGEDIGKIIENDKSAVVHLSDTGVVVVTDITEKIVITMYPANPRQFVSIYRQIMGSNQAVDKKMFKQVVKNYNKYSYFNKQVKIDVEYDYNEETKRKAEQRNA